jgi:hypothetical protein
MCSPRRRLGGARSHHCGPRQDIRALYYVLPGPRELGVDDGRKLLPPPLADRRLVRLLPACVACIVWCLCVRVSVSVSSLAAFAVCLSGLTPRSAHLQLGLLVRLLRGALCRQLSRQAHAHCFLVCVCVTRHSFLRFADATGVCASNDNKDVIIIVCLCVIGFALGELGEPSSVS